MDTSNVRPPLRREDVNDETSTHGLFSNNRKIVNGQNRNIGTAEVGLEVVAEPRGTRAEASRRTEKREMSSEDMLIAYEELEREMNELRNNIGKKTNPSDSEALSAWRKLVEMSRTEAYNNLEVRVAKLADVADRARGRRYGGARIIEVAPIRESTANATANATENATVDATDAPEGRSTSVACKERGEGLETMDKSRGKAKNIKKEETSESKRIKSERRAKTEASRNDAETRPKEKKKNKTRLRQPSTSTESREEKEDTQSKRTSHHKNKEKKKRNKNRCSDTEEEEKSYKKTTKEKSCKDKGKTKKRRKLEFLT